MGYHYPNRKLIAFCVEHKSPTSMKISIITIAYNSSGTIAETLRLVAAPSCADIEHIIVDGGYTDDTLTMVRMQRQSVAHVVSDPDRGIYDAMNKGQSAGMNPLNLGGSGAGLLDWPALCVRRGASACAAWSARTDDPNGVERGHGHRHSGTGHCRVPVCRMAGAGANAG